MSTVINLTGVEAASSQNAGGDRKFMKPGIQTLTISKLELTKSGTGKDGIKVTFDSTENEASFNETFWLSAGALPRLQYLIKAFTGDKHEGQLTVEELEAKLVGKSEVIIVDGREALSNPVPQEDGTVKTYINVYPKLRFADFAIKDITNEANKVVRMDELDKTVSASTAGSSSNNAPDDLPF